MTATPSSTSVRVATEDDRLEIFKLCVAMHRETDFRHYTLDAQKTVDSLGTWLHSNNAVMFVSEKSGEITGFFAAKLVKPWFSEDVMAVEDIFFVAKHHRGSRAGLLLVKAFYDWAKTSGAAHIRAGVSSGSGGGGERLYMYFGLVNMGGNFVAHFQEKQYVLQ